MLLEKQFELIPMAKIERKRTETIDFSQKSKKIVGTKIGIFLNRLLIKEKQSNREKLNFKSNEGIRENQIRTSSIWALSLRK